MINRRTFFGLALALAASVPALAQSLKMPKRESVGVNLREHERFMFVIADRFDGWNVKREQFRIKTNRFPVGTEENHWWEHTIPFKVLNEASYIAVIGGPVLKDRYLIDPPSQAEMMLAPFYSDDELIARGWRIARNESYTAI